MKLRQEPETKEFSIETRTLPHIFARAGAQTTQIIYPDQTISAILMEKLSVEGETPSLLLRNWINLVIHAFHERGMAFSTFEVRQLGPKGNSWYLQVEAVGILRDAALAPSIPPVICSAAEITGDEQTCRADFTLSAYVPWLDKSDRHQKGKLETS